MIKDTLVAYIEENILPNYKNFDSAHDVSHVKQVIKNSLEMAEEYDLDRNIIYAAAAYHDMGLKVERAKHEVYSKDIMLNDKNLDRFFTSEEKEIIAEAILTHRASNKREPVTLYGKVIADADNDLDPERIIERMVLYSIGHYPDFKKAEHLVRCYDHAIEKYSEHGYLRLWLDSKANKDNLSKVREIIADKDLFEQKFSHYFDKHVDENFQRKTAI